MPKIDSQNNLIVLDDGMDCDRDAKIIAHWSELVVDHGHVSIPLEVERKAKGLRKEYLSWVYELGNLEIDNKSIREFLKLDQSCSFWWMTLIAEKSPFKSPIIHDVLKLRVLEELYFERNACGIILFSSNQALHETLSAWCHSLGHPYQRVVRSVSRTRTDDARWYHRVPHWIRAVGSVIRWWWKIARHVGRAPLLPDAPGQATVVTYFPNIDLDQAASNIFHSHYWGKLHDLLDRYEGTINWLWMFQEQAYLPITESVLLRDRLNESLIGKHRFYFLEEFIGSKAVWKAIRKFAELFTKGIRLQMNGIRSGFQFSGSCMNFWPFLKEDWYRSVFGRVAMEGCLWLSAFEEISRRFPQQQWCLFPYEGQAWERALTTAWCRNQGTRSIGAQHSTVSLMDLRYFEDPRAYANDVNSVPLPSIVAVNGEGPLDLLGASGFPMDRLTVVEAVRYLYLEGKRNLAAAVHTRLKKTLLIITGYLELQNDFQLGLLVEASKLGALVGYEKIVIKPHPYCSVDSTLSDISLGVQIEIKHESLSNLWDKADVVYAANSTSAALESLVYGLPTIVAIASDAINLSPLFGIMSSTFVSNVDELADRLRTPLIEMTSRDYFLLDKRLMYWRALLL